MTDLEARVLAAVIDLGEAGDRELAERIGLTRRALTPAVRRLVELDYVTKATVDSRPVYRPRQLD